MGWGSTNDHLARSVEDEVGRRFRRHVVHPGLAASVQQPLGSKQAVALELGLQVAEGLLVQVVFLSELSH
jgi:hypothetical protein